MPFNHYVLTLTGVAQRLSSVLANTTIGNPEDSPVYSLSIQPGAANANAAYVGDADVSAVSYAVRLEPAVAGTPPAPFMIESRGGVKPSDLWVIGTADEILHIGIVPMRWDTRP